MQPPYIVLGHYTPITWSARLVGRALTELTASHGLLPHPDLAHGPIHWKGRSWFSEALHAEVRRRTSKKPDAEEWHQDGDTTPDAKMDCALVTWATRAPTEWRYRGEIFQPQPLEIVIARNLTAEHRRPPAAPRVRWMFRQRVIVPTHLGLP